MPICLTGMLQGISTCIVCRSSAIWHNPIEVHKSGERHVLREML
jgi:hypothetical protein